MTMNSTMAVILRYSTEFGSFVCEIIQQWLKVDLYCLTTKV